MGNNVFFDANQVAPIQGGGGVLPLGEYNVIVDGVEIKPTKDNSSGYLQLDLRCTSQGPNLNATGAYRLNIYNQSEQAKNIAKGQLSAICHVSGRYQLSNPQDLVGAEFRVKVQPQRDNDEYTEVSAVLNFDGSKPKAGQPASQKVNENYQAPNQAAQDNFQQNNQAQGQAPNQGGNAGGNDWQGGNTGQGQPQQNYGEPTFQNNQGQQQSNQGGGNDWQPNGNQGQVQQNNQSQGNDWQAPNQSQDQNQGGNTAWNPGNNAGGTPPWGQ